ncbi:hypothetical protein FKP32DRAFT_1589092 [Trametes sanguinea]|nr:hypothetical protein FKP32DRAFT_1589092 [Trametes sanguinea]
MQATQLGGDALCTEQYSERRALRSPLAQRAPNRWYCMWFRRRNGSANAASVRTLSIRRGPSVRPSCSCGYLPETSSGQRAAS